MPTYARSDGPPKARPVALRVGESVSGAVGRRKVVPGKCRRLTAVNWMNKPCSLRRVKCDEEKPYCKRCRRLGYLCHGYKRLENPAEKHQQHVAKQITTLELYQPPVVVSPVQVVATPQELDIFHYYRTQVTRHRADGSTAPCGMYTFSGLRMTSLRCGTPAMLSRLFIRWMP